MSAKSSRNKKQAQRRKGAQPAARPEANNGAQPASAAKPVPDPVTAGGSRPPVTTAPPLQAFRAPTVSPPAPQFPPPRTAAPARAGFERGTSSAVPRSAGQGPRRSAAAVPASVAQQPPVPLGPPAGTSVAAPPETRAPEATTPAMAGGSVAAVRTVAGGPPLLARDMPEGPVQVLSWNCSQVEGAEPQGLGMTYWFDAAPDGDPYPVNVRFTGRRISGDRADGGNAAFETVRSIEQVVPGSGRIALTTRIPDVAPGTWEVTATPVLLRRPDGTSSEPPRGWLPRGSSTGTTTFLPVVRVRAPGVRLGAWPALVGAGFLVALVLQWLLAAPRQLPVGRLLLVTVLASLVGLVGAKVYYLLTHRAEKARALTAGMSIQGFVLTAISTLLLGGWGAGIPIGAMLDVSAPGLLFGMTIGRLGCFLGGCCVGLPTASRWGIWSSDRGVGVRRIPVQLFESAMAGVIAMVTLLAVALVDPEVDGLLFVIGLAAYTFGRQMLFPLRGIPRTTTYGRVAVMALTGSVVAASVLLLVSA